MPYHQLPEEKSWDVCRAIGEGDWYFTQESGKQYSKVKEVWYSTATWLNQESVLGREAGKLNSLLVCFLQENEAKIIIKPVNNCRRQTIYK